jgi:hypothetical protein
MSHDIYGRHNPSLLRAMVCISSSFKHRNPQLQKAYVSVRAKFSHPIISFPKTGLKTGLEPFPILGSERPPNSLGIRLRIVSHIRPRKAPKQPQNQAQNRSLQVRCSRRLCLQVCHQFRGPYFKARHSFTSHQVCHQFRGPIFKAPHNFRCSLQIRQLRGPIPEHSFKIFGIFGFFGFFRFFEFVSSEALYQSIASSSSD